MTELDIFIKALMFRLEMKEDWPPLTAYGLWCIVRTAHEAVEAHRDEQAAHQEAALIGVRDGDIA